MRKVTRSYLLVDAPAILQRQSTIDACTILARAADATLIKRAIYSDPYQADDDEGLQSRVIDKLNDWYFSKCAYCERFYKLDVEHYRPKGEVRGEDNELISDTGYYWLGYEWSNLLPACISCNRDGGKNSKFPYLKGGTVVSAPSFGADSNLDFSLCLATHQNFKNELPALLNPELDDDFETFFNFVIDDQREGIRIIGVDKDRRGEITAKICKLNRQEIRQDRLQTVVMNFANSISTSIRKYKITNDLVLFMSDIDTQLQKLYDDVSLVKLNHTLLRKYIVKSKDNFNQIVIPFIVPEFQPMLLKRFEEYKPI